MPISPVVDGPQRDLHILALCEARGDRLVLQLAEDPAVAAGDIAGPDRLVVVAACVMEQVELQGKRFVRRVARLQRRSECRQGIARLLFGGEQARIIPFEHDPRWFRKMPVQEKYDDRGDCAADDDGHEPLHSNSSVEITD